MYFKITYLFFSNKFSYNINIPNALERRLGWNLALLFNGTSHWLAICYYVFLTLGFLQDTCSFLCLISTLYPLLSLTSEIKNYSNQNHSSGLEIKYALKTCRKLIKSFNSAYGMILFIILLCSVIFSAELLSDYSQVILGLYIYSLSIYFQYVWITYLAVSVSYQVCGFIICFIAKV